MLRYAAAAILAGTTALAGTIAGPALAADENDQFAVRGAGIANCQQYLDARDSRSQQYFQFGGWMNGYISALNRFEENTFDLVPWQSPDFLASALANYCRANPEQSFHNAVLLMAETLKAQRLESSSELAEVPMEGLDEPLRIYRATLQRVEAALNEAGYDAGEADGTYDQQTEEALRNFQEAEALNVTGVPDQATLLRIFYPQATAQGGSE